MTEKIWSVDYCIERFEITKDKSDLIKKLVQVEVVDYPDDDQVNIKFPEGDILLVPKDRLIPVGSFQ